MTGTRVHAEVIAAMDRRTAAQRYGAIRDRIEAVAALVSMACNAASALDDEAADCMGVHAKLATAEGIWELVVSGVATMAKTAEAA